MNEPTGHHIIVFGATGNTGQQVVQQALDRGMRVTAFVRDPAKLDIDNDRLTVAQGNILDRTSIDAALGPQFDAAICAVGVFSRKPSTELSDGTKNIIAALDMQGIRRFIVVSSLGVHDSKGQGNWAARAWQRYMIPKVLEDKERQEALIRDSGLDWTVYRPARILIDPAIREGLVEWSGPEPDTRLTWALTMGTLAKKILDALDEPASVRRALCLSDPR